MRVLALDLSTKAGYAVLDSGSRSLDPKPALVCSGTIELPKPIAAFGSYPWCYLEAATHIAMACGRIREFLMQEEMKKPGAPMRDIDYVVIEETNLGKSRYAQKILEFIHLMVLLTFRNMGPDSCGGKNGPDRVVYLSSSEWRSNLGLTMSAQERKNNRKLSEIKSLIRDRHGDLTSSEARADFAQAKKRSGIRGRVNAKHLSVKFVNEFFGLSLKIKDNNTADAICLALAYLNGATICDGAMER